MLMDFFYPRPVLVFGYCRCLRLSVRVFSRNITYVVNFRYSWPLYGYFGLCGWPHKTIANDFMKCLYMSCVFWLRRKHTHIMDTCVCPSVHVWTETKRHTSYGHLCPCVHVRAVRCYITPVLWLVIGTVVHFVAVLFICNHTKPIATQEKRHSDLLTKVAWHTDAATQNPIATQEKIHPDLWTKVATGHPFVCPSVCPCLCVSTPSLSARVVLIFH